MSKEKLNKLLKRNEELKPIVFMGFDTSNELQKYFKTIQKELDEYYANQEQIIKLRYELMTPEEKEKYHERRRINQKRAKDMDEWP
jgi:hypothetical protein